MNVFFVLFLVIIVLMVCGVFDVSTERYVLAQDIESGKLILTPQAQLMIDKGDSFLNDAGRSVEGQGYSKNWKVFDSDLFRAFIAKVWFERARLEMELQK